MAAEKLYTTTTYRAFLNFRHGKIRNICFGDETQSSKQIMLTFQLDLRLVRYTN